MTTPPSEVELHIQLRTKLTHDVNLRVDAYDHIIDLRYDIIGEYLLNDPETDDMESHECHLGEINLQVIRVGEARTEGWNPFEFFDQVQSLNTLSCALYDFEADAYKAGLRKRFPHATNNWNDIIYVDNIILKPWARGQNLSLSVLQCVERTWSSGCEFMVLQPYPMQFCSLTSETCSAKYGLDQLSDNEQLSIKKLEFHYEQLGYRKLDKSPYLLKWILGKHDISVDLDSTCTIPLQIAQQNTHP
ncbi:MAG: hypothetical protein ACI9FG_001292 [Crocinitomicaceae bacterium]|jgi:hypothetical protein